MTSVWENLTIGAEDPARLARWWAEALGYRIVHERPGAVEIRQDGQGTPALVFVSAAGAKTTRNRLHLDLRPVDTEAEVERLVDMGARHVAAGRDDPGVTMLADPEGNEFRILRQRDRAG